MDNCGRGGFFVFWLGVILNHWQPLLNPSFLLSLHFEISWVLYRSSSLVWPLDGISRGSSSSLWQKFPTGLHHPTALFVRPGRCSHMRHCVTQGAPYIVPRRSPTFGPWSRRSVFTPLRHCVRLAQIKINFRACVMTGVRHDGSLRPPQAQWLSYFILLRKYTYFLIMLRTTS